MLGTPDQTAHERAHVIGCPFVVFVVRLAWLHSTIIRRSKGKIQRMDTRLTRVMPDDAQQLITREWHAKPEQIHLLSGSVDVPVADLCNKSRGGVRQKRS